MRDLAGWEILLGGALLVFLLWRWRPRGGTPTRRTGDAAPDWKGLLLPILAVALFVVLLIYTVRG